MVELICLLIIAFMFIIFFGTLYLASCHCKKLGVTFKDFYFGTKMYDKALAKYKRNER